MLHKEKMRLLKYYASATCICGKTKHKNRWICLTCKSVAENTIENDILENACNNHLRCAKEYLNITKMINEVEYARTA